MWESSVTEHAVIGRESSGHGQVVVPFYTSLGCSVNGQFGSVRGDQPPAGKGQWVNMFSVTGGKERPICSDSVERRDYHLGL